MLLTLQVCTYSYENSIYIQSIMHIQVLIWNCNISKKVWRPQSLCFESMKMIVRLLQ